MDHVRELDGIADEEGREVVADQVPVTVGGVETRGKAAWVTQGFRGMQAMHHRRETHEYRGSLTRGEHLGPGQLGNIG
ncbi:hypothetical protein D3C77_787090 [compost metagenome]